MIVLRFRLKYTLFICLFELYVSNYLYRQSIVDSMIFYK